PWRLPAGDDRAWRRRRLDDALDHGGVLGARGHHVKPSERQPLDALGRLQRLRLEPQVAVHLGLGRAFLLHLLEAVAVAAQLELLPGPEEQHRDEEHADGHRPDHLAVPLPIDFAHDRVVANVLLDRVFEGFGVHADTSAARSLALRARGLRSISAAAGTSGRLVRTRRPHSPAACIERRTCFTTRSSSEWNVMTTSLPPGRSRAATVCRQSPSPSSSRLTQMRTAWNVRVAGSMRV